MSDKKTEIMLKVADSLSAEELEQIKAMAPAAACIAEARACADETQACAVAEAEPTEGLADGLEAADGRSAITAPPVDPGTPATTRRVAGKPRSRASRAGMARGEYERQRTRESKVATTCVGHERQRHDWWPVGTDLIGQIGSEIFTATVVENPNVKSNRSLLITSGPANGRVCITPTRAAMEATESYRQAHNLGRSGGVTNGWDFWQPRT